MGKGDNTDNVLDDQEIPGQDDQDDAQKDTSVRGSIKAALEAHRDDGEGDKEPPKDKEEPKDIEETRVSSRRPKVDKRVSDVEPVEGEDKKEDKKEAKEEVKLDPPPFYRNKGKATWDKLSTEDKQTLVAREKEVSDGFAQISQRIRAVEDLEKVISPRLPMIQQLGVPPVQVVDRLFQWMDALQGPNKVEAFKDLAKSVGLNPTQFAGQSNTPTQPDDTSADQPPPWFSEFTGAVDQKLSKVAQIEQEIADQKQVHAHNQVMQWAKDKTHYQKVAPLMGQLLQSGIVGLKADGSVDLDGAYERAIKLDPEVAALIQQEAAEKATKEAQEKAEKEAKEKSDKLIRARRAGSGLRPAPASGPSTLPNANANAKGMNGKQDKTVRGSIRAALEELRET